MLSELILRTPLIPYVTDDPVLRGRIFLKPENLQPFGSYKIRGVASVVMKSEAGQLKSGLSAASAGNMAQAVAFAARIAGVPCRIFIPESAPSVKKEAIVNLGAQLVELPYEDVWKLVRENGAPDSRGLFIHPVFTPALLEGYASMATEIMADLPETEAVIIPFGVGGLTLGMGRALRAINPRVAVFPCEPETASPLHASLEAGRPLNVKRTPSFIDATGTPEVLPDVFEAVAPLVAGSLVTPLAETRRALTNFLFSHKLLCEGAGATALAGALQLARATGYKKIVAILTGGNISPQVLGELQRQESVAE